MSNVDAWKETRYGNVIEQLWSSKRSKIWKCYWEIGTLKKKYDMEILLSNCDAQKETRCGNIIEQLWHSKRKQDMEMLLSNGEAASDKAKTLNWDNRTLKKRNRKYWHDKNRAKIALQTSQNDVREPLKSQ